MWNKQRFRRIIVLVFVIALLSSLSLSVSVVSAQSDTGGACSLPTNEISGQAGFQPGALAGFQPGALAGFQPGALSFGADGTLVTPAGLAGFQPGALDADALEAIRQEAEAQRIDPTTFNDLWAALYESATFGNTQTALIIADDFPDNGITGLSLTHGEQVEQVFVDMIVAANAAFGLGEPGLLENVDIYRVDVTSQGVFVPISDGLGLEDLSVVSFAPVTVSGYPASLNVVRSSVTDDAGNLIGGIAKRVDDTIDELKQYMVYDSFVFNFSVGLVPCEAQDVPTGTEGKTIDWDIDEFASSDGATTETEIPLIVVEPTHSVSGESMENTLALVLNSGKDSNRYFLLNGDRYDLLTSGNTIVGNEQTVLFSANGGSVYWFNGRQRIGVRSAGERGGDRDSIQPGEQLILDLEPEAENMMVKVQGDAEVIADFFFRGTLVDTISMMNSGVNVLTFTPEFVFDQVVLSAASGAYGIKSNSRGRGEYALFFNLFTVEFEDPTPFQYFLDELGLTPQEAIFVLNTLLRTYDDPNLDDVALLRDMLNKHLAQCAAPGGVDFVPVAAAGNSRLLLGEAPLAPASWYNMIGISALLGFGDGDAVYPETNVIDLVNIALSGDRATFSMTGDLSVPGAWNFFGFDADGNPLFGAGTSYAAPHASAVASIISLGGGRFNCGTTSDIKVPVTQNLLALDYLPDNDPITSTNLQYDFTYDDDDTEYEGPGDPPVCEDVEATIWVGQNNIIQSTNPAQHGMEYTGTLMGTNQNDIIVGTAGDDIIYGDEGQDFICGQDGNDTIYGGEGIDILYGGSGHDHMDGGNAIDTLYGGMGDDYLNGNHGSDMIYPGAGNDTIVAGEGQDTVSYAGAVGAIIAVLDTTMSEIPYYPYVLEYPAMGALYSAAYTTLDVSFESVDTLFDVENIIGSNFNDIIYGDWMANVLDGGGGHDLIFGGGGNDQILGENGNDKLIGDSGSDTIYGGDHGDLICGDAAYYDYEEDYLVCEGSEYESEIPTIIVPEDDDDVSEYCEGNNCDLIYGGNGPDVIDGGPGADTIFGGEGDDTINGDESDYIEE